MRQIDADALIKRIKDTFCAPCKKEGSDYECVRCCCCQYGDEMEHIENAPTVDTVTVVR